MSTRSNNYQSTLGCNQIVSTALTWSKAVAAKQDRSNNYHDPKSPNTLVLVNRDRCEVQAIQRSILHKPKKEPPESSNIHSSDLEKISECQPVDKNARKGFRTPKRKALQNPHVSSGLGSASISSYYNDFVPGVASL